MASLWDRFLDLDNFQQAWEKVAANKGCAGVDGETIAHFAERADSNLEALRKSLIKDRYSPLPLRQIPIPKKNGGWRILRVPTVRDRVVQQAMLNVLHPVLDPQFEDSSFAYRPGRSHLLAVQQVNHWYQRGYMWVMDADIVKYFDNVQHQRLIHEVAERLKHAQLLDLLQAWIEVPTLTKTGLLFPEQGIPQGSVVSPILANVYLDDFDERCDQYGYKLVRYADDFVVLSRSQAHVQEIQTHVGEWLESMGLQLHPDKTQITSFKKGFRFLGHVFAHGVILPVKKLKQEHLPEVVSDMPYRVVHSEEEIQPTLMQQALVKALKCEKHPLPPPLFVALGYAIRPYTPVKITSNESVWKPEMATLYLVQQGSTLSKEQGRFRVEQPKEPTVEIPIREVECVLVFGTIHLTPAAISTCLQQAIPVIFLSQLGDYKGHLWSGEGRQVRVEMAQFQKFADLDFQLAVARALVLGKLMNSRQFLLRLNRKRKLAQVVEKIEGIQADIHALATAETLDQVRGYEGSAAARYFPALGALLVNPGFHFEHRKRRPPPDPVNALLSYGYTLLFNNVLSLLLAEGLHPYLGNLHRSDRHEPHLAFDLMEEFRSPIVDSLVVQLINRQVLKPTDFSWPDEERGVFLEKPGNRIFLREFEKRMSSAASHPDVQEQVTYRRAIQLQIQRYKRTLLDGIPYEAFLRAV